MVNRLIAVAVLALVPMVAAGQEWDGVIKVGVDTTYGLRVDMAQLYADIREYEMECWADSTRHERVGLSLGFLANDEDTNYVYVETECPDNQLGNMIHCAAFHYARVPRFYWTHRRPDFADFINWLNRKYPRP